MTTEALRVVGEAIEDAALRHLGRDLGTIHRDKIAAAAYAAALRHVAAEWKHYRGTDAYAKGVLDTIATIRQFADEAEQA
jgi:hypothetical protein